jgi:hypothetical protein
MEQIFISELTFFNTNSLLDEAYDDDAVAVEISMQKNLPCQKCK